VEMETQDVNSQWWMPPLKRSHGYH